MTADLSRRIHQHRSSQGSSFCRRYGLDRLVLVEEYPTIEEAIVREKRLKKFNRDLQFLEALQFPVQPLAGVVLELKEDHCRVWVAPWKRVVSVPRTDLAIGERVLVKYHLNMEPMSWKRRLVVEVS